MPQRLVCSIVAVVAVSLSLAASVVADTPRLGMKEAPVKASGTIRLATYNILNLFDELDDPTLTGKYDDWYDQDRVIRAKPESERKAAADTIRRLNADVLCLEEIESYEALIEFRDQFLADMGYEYVVSIDVGQERGIENAVMSRFPLTDIKVWPGLELGGNHPEKYGNQKNWYAGEAITFRRSPLRVTVQIPQDLDTTRDDADPYEITLFVVHHKSGYYNGYWREKEAAKIMEFIKELEREQPGINIAVLGDFNAQHDTPEVKVYLDAGMIDLFGEDKGYPVEPRLTHESDRRIDLILMNQNLANEADISKRLVLGTPVRAKGADYRSVAAPEGYASDHMPVSVDIAARDAEVLGESEE